MRSSRSSISFNASSATLEISRVISSGPGWYPEPRTHTLQYEWMYRRPLSPAFRSKGWHPRSCSLPMAYMPPVLNPKPVRPGRYGSVRQYLAAHHALIFAHNGFLVNASSLIGTHKFGHPVTFPDVRHLAQTNLPGALTRSVTPSLFARITTPESQAADIPCQFRPAAPESAKAVLPDVACSRHESTVGVIVFQNGIIAVAMDTTCFDTST